jgi:hypothetical protein
MQILMRRRKWREAKGFGFLQPILDCSRGLSPYDVLEEAKIVTELGRLLDLVDPFESDRSENIQTMMPPRWFNRDVAYTAWMHRFVTDPEAMFKVDMN